MCPTAAPECRGAAGLGFLHANSYRLYAYPSYNFQRCVCDVSDGADAKWDAECANSTDDSAGFFADDACRADTCDGDTGNDGSCDDSEDGSSEDRSSEARSCED